MVREAMRYLSIPLRLIYIEGKAYWGSVFRGETGESNGGAEGAGSADGGNEVEFRLNRRRGPGHMPLQATCCSLAMKMAT